MAGGLTGLLDDVAALAKLAAASIDDIGTAAGKASTKTAALMIDDTAVTPAYVSGLAADRELPIIKRIAKGSIFNKLLLILPIALLLSEFAPKVVEIILICGGTYLSFEGVEKIWHKIKGDDHSHDLPVAMKGPEAEEGTIKAAVRTDLILSAEIMVIALKEVIDETVFRRALILIVVAFLITALVYGAVALIVKMDDIGLSLAQRESPSAKKLGFALVNGMPKLLVVLTVVGTAAMLWVGGHIIIVGLHELGWDGLYDPVHDAEEWAKDIAGIGGVLAWFVNTFLSAIVGIIVGAIVVAVMMRLPWGHGDNHGDDHGDDHGDAH